MGWPNFRFLRGRPPADSAENWMPGDLAECVADGPWYLFGRFPSPGPQKGEVRIVTDVAIADIAEAGPRQWLAFARYNGQRFNAACFVKIPPRADAQEAGEAEWLNQFLTTPLKQPERAPCDS